MKQEIIGANHPIIKKTASLKEKKYRERYGEFVVEGAMSVLWAIDSSYTVKTIIVSEDFVPPASLAQKLLDKPVYQTSSHVFAKMADTKTPQGILCTCALPSARSLPESGLYVYCDRVRDPGNVGSIIRSADAMGFNGVMLSPESVDPYNPKLVRSTMGSLFHIDIYTDVDCQSLHNLKEQGFSLAVSALTANSIPSFKWKTTSKTIVVLGNEAGGVTEETLSMADTIVKIPMSGGAESLNVAAAGAILMYEATMRKQEE